MKKTNFNTNPMALEKVYVYDTFTTYSFRENNVERNYKELQAFLTEAKDKAEKYSYKDWVIVPYYDESYTDGEDNNYIPAEQGLDAKGYRLEIDAEYRQRLFMMKVNNQDIYQQFVKSQKDNVGQKCLDKISAIETALKNIKL
jgi:hypothetical protein